MMPDYVWISIIVISVIVFAVSMFWIGYSVRLRQEIRKFQENLRGKDDTVWGVLQRGSVHGHQSMAGEYQRGTRADLPPMWGVYPNGDFRQSRAGLLGGFPRHVRPSDHRQGDMTMTRIPESAVEAVYNSRSGQSKKIGDFVSRSDIRAALLLALPHLKSREK
jgi:hypothetical protein